MSWLREYKVFLHELRTSVRETGAFAPSGPALCRELASRVAGSGATGRRILEVGPGTGVATRKLLPLLGEGDRLTVVEINPGFVALLREKFAPGGEWHAYADSVEVLEMPIQDLDDQQRFDYIVSSLPLNNFESELVESIFQKYHNLAADGAELSFFQYVGVRGVKALFVSRRERARIAAVGQVFADQLRHHEFGHKTILANIPPARVHHLKLQGGC